MSAIEPSLDYALRDLRAEDLSRMLEIEQSSLAPPGGGAPSRVCSGAATPT